MATEEEDGQRTQSGKEIWRRKWRVISIITIIIIMYLLQ